MGLHEAVDALNAGQFKQAANLDICVVLVHNEQEHPGQRMYYVLWKSDKRYEAFKTFGFVDTEEPITSLDAAVRARRFETDFSSIGCPRRFNGALNNRQLKERVKFLHFLNKTLIKDPGRRWNPLDAYR